MTQHSTFRATAVAPLRRLAWRLGRRVYCAARGEPRADDIATDGEAYVQHCVIKGVDHRADLCVFDIGANCGDWSASFLSALSTEHRSHYKTNLHLFEPVPATRQVLQSRLAQMDGSGIAEVHALAMSNECGGAAMAIVSDTGCRSSLSLDIEATRGAENLIEVKTTNGWERTPFHISRNELEVAQERRADWRLLRLWNFARDPKAFELTPPLDAHVSLTATTFQASFR